MRFQSVFRKRSVWTKADREDDSSVWDLSNEDILSNVISSSKHSSVSMDGKSILKYHQGSIMKKNSIDHFLSVSPNIWMLVPPLSTGIPITDPKFFSQMSVEQLAHVLRSDNKTPMPMLQERHQVWTLTHEGSLSVLLMRMICTYLLDFKLYSSAFF